ncbi:hypothetical protein [Methylobacterium sp. J-068]|uniref:hypothetical protein n=1 Tax=Methylobacterium sp. J-068 TaxID=2836649 RepID=UPI001FB9F7CB|nr:hypothetical protein [Methylobacterium sp. J-068]MCJ2035050.1 hypothetical protein [Methylobacterium sp. J-068]
MLPPSRFIETPRDGDALDEEVPAPRRPSTLLPWTIKLCLAVGLVALGATQYLSRVVEPASLRQREARAGQLDPETTGSIGEAAARTTLDPCTAAGLRR